MHIAYRLLLVLKHHWRPVQTCRALLTLHLLALALTPLPMQASLLHGRAPSLTWILLVRVRVS